MGGVSGQIAVTWRLHLVEVVLQGVNMRKPACCVLILPPAHALAWVQVQGRQTCHVTVHLGQANRIVRRASRTAGSPSLGIVCLQCFAVWMTTDAVALRSPKLYRDKSMLENLTSEHEASKEEFNRLRECKRRAAAECLL
eukprot:6178640-Pleurochrysis_carterae.AAC.4